MFSSFLHCLSLPPGSSGASGPRPQGKPPWCFSWCQTPPRFCTSIWKGSDECSLFLFLMSSMEDERYFLLLLSSSMEEKRRLLKNPSSSMEDEHSFYILLSSPLDDKRSFFVLLSSEPSDECSFFCFPLIRCFRDTVFPVFSPWGSYRTRIG